MFQNKSIESFLDAFLDVFSLNYNKHPSNVEYYYFGSFQNFNNIEASIYSMQLSHNIILILSGEKNLYRWCATLENIYQQLIKEANTKITVILCNTPNASKYINYLSSFCNCLYLSDFHCVFRWFIEQSDYLDTIARKHDIALVLCGAVDAGKFEGETKDKIAKLKERLWYVKAIKIAIANIISEAREPEKTSEMSPLQLSDLGSSSQKLTLYFQFVVDYHRFFHKHIYDIRTLLSRIAMCFCAEQIEYPQLLGIIKDLLYYFECVDTSVFPDFTNDYSPSIFLEALTSEHLSLRLNNHIEEDDPWEADDDAWK